MASETKKYKITVLVKLGKMSPYRVDVETDDEVGAVLLAKLLKSHDEEVLLLEVTETRHLRTLPVQKWPTRRRRIAK